MTRKLEPEPLPPGAWRLDPFTRVLRYVYDDPEVTVPDAFDEPLEVAPEPKRRGRKRGQSHGDIAGVRAHERRREPICDDCKRARLDYRRWLVARRFEEGDPRFTCPECAGPKHQDSKHCATCAVTVRYSKTYRKAA